MTTEYQCRYTFDLNDINYIKAIVNYNGEGVVVESHPPMSTPFSCSHLQLHLSIMENKSELKLSITCKFQDEKSTKGIFPSLDNVDLLKLSGLNPSALETEYSFIKENLDIIIEELEFDDDADASDVFLVNKSINRVTQAQAYLILHQLKQKFALQGAIHLPNLQTILFQERDRNHLLVYGENSRYIESAQIIFDLNDGFSTTPYLFAELQKFYITWVEQKFSDRLIPEENHGFNLVPPPEPLTIPFLSSLWQMITEQLMRLYHSMHVPRLNFSFFSRRVEPVHMVETLEPQPKNNLN